MEFETEKKGLPFEDSVLAISRLNNQIRGLNSESEAHRKLTDRRQRIIFDLLRRRNNREFYFEVYVYGRREEISENSAAIVEINFGDFRYSGRDFIISIPINRIAEGGGLSNSLEALSLIQDATFLNPSLLKKKNRSMPRSF